MSKKILSLLIIMVLVILNLSPMVLAIENVVETNTNNNTSVKEETQMDNQIDVKESKEEEKKEEEQKEEEIIEETSTTLEEPNSSEIIEENEKEKFADKTEEIIQDGEVSFSIEIANETIKPYFKDEIYYFFIPQEISINNVTIKYSGNVTEISNGIINKNKTITNDFSQNELLSIIANGQQFKLKVMQSDLPSMSISLNNVTLSDINSGSKEIKYNGNTVNIKSPNNTKQDLVISNVEIKGRGNYTWGLPKRGYQIKFNKKQSVLGMKKAKTWILLANYLDNTFARNRIAFDLAKEAGLNYTPDYRFIDVWVDGNYLGNYMITEKVQVNENRVNLSNEEGLLIELDNQYYLESDNWFSSNISQTKFTLKDSVADDENNEQSISRKAFNDFKEYINTFEYYLYSENKDWNKISKLIDVDSFIKYYFVQEMSENPDGCRSSVFLYKDGKNDVIHMGPVWDYDISFGNYNEKSLGGNVNTDYLINIQKYREFSNDWFSQLFKIKEFRKKVSDVFNNEIKPKLNIIKNNSYNNMQKSAIMNNILWNTLGKRSLIGRINKNSYNEECEYLNSWIQNRINYLEKRYNNNSEIFDVKYKTHIQDNGWQNFYSNNGEVAGTSGQAKRLEAIKILLDTFNKELLENAQLKYQVHAQDYGWMEWKQDGEMAGTSGESKRLEAIRIVLENSDEYSIKYRVHVQNIGWTDWVYDGEVAGTEGKSLRLEAIEIQVVKKQIGNTTPNSNALINYKGHIENVGDTGYVCDGETIGTTGRGLRLEGLQIQLGNSLPSDISLNINEHVENIGWINGLSEKDYIGTQGRAQRLEALSFKLKGESAKNYTIKYRVHVQNIGWQNWKQDGEIAGTTGQSLRIEAIQILVEPK